MRILRQVAPWHIVDILEAIAAVVLDKTSETPHMQHVLTRNPALLGFGFFSPIPPAQIGLKDAWSYVFVRFPVVNERQDMGNCSMLYRLNRVA